jgi:hypothetical protein
MPAVFALEQRAIPGVPEPEQSATQAAFAPTHRFLHKPQLSQESNATSVSLAFADLALRLHFQEVADHLVTALGQY